MKISLFMMLSIETMALLVCLIPMIPKTNAIEYFKILYRFLQVSWNVRNLFPGKITGAKLFWLYHKSYNRVENADKDEYCGVNFESKLLGMIGVLGKRIIFQGF